MTRIHVREGDVALEPLDAIFSAAEGRMGQRSDRVLELERRAGPEFQAECRDLALVEPGGAALTGAGDLTARFVVHVGVADAKGCVTRESVGAALRAGLELASSRGCATVGVAALGNESGELSAQDCAESLMEVAREVARSGTAIEDLHFILEGEPLFRVFEMVRDAAKVEEQMKKLRDRRGGASS
ncbi:macro domain-containing protein [Myxococcota bacterium]|nr:macro domain-containing protein [Myxococcota bacterium]